MGFNLMMHTGEWFRAEWIEYIPAETKEDEPCYAITPIDFRYRQFADDSGQIFPLPGMRSTGLGYTIETSDNIKFKPLDKIQFPDDKVFKVKDVATIRQTGNNMAAFTFPGAVEDYIRQIITL